MNTFNTPPSPSRWLSGQKRKPGRNDALTHVRAAIRQQRQNWSNQTGKPPIKESRAGHGWETWETTLIQDQQDHMTLADLAAWTGRTTTEILNHLESLDDHPAADPFEDEEEYIY